MMQKSLTEGSQPDVPMEKIFGENVGSRTHHLFVDLCIDYIDKYGVHEQGIYRKCGASSAINRLKELVESNPTLSHFDGSEDVHDVAGCLKCFFREMPQPLLTFELYDAFIASSETIELNSDISIVNKVLRLLPFDNLYILKKLIFHLNKIHLNSQENLMKSSNLAIVFAPNLLRSLDESPEIVIGDSRLSTFLFIKFIEEPLTFFNESLDEIMYNRAKESNLFKKRKRRRTPSYIKIFRQ